MSHNSPQPLIEDITQEVVKRLVSRAGNSLPQALCTFLNSQTYQKLSDPLTGLYIESPSFIYAMYNDEVKYGKLIQ